MGASTIPILSVPTVGGPSKGRRLGLGIRSVSESILHRILARNNTYNRVRRYEKALFNLRTGAHINHTLVIGSHSPERCRRHFYCLPLDYNIKTVPLSQIYTNAFFRCE